MMPDISTSGLLTDLYQFTMVQGYLEHDLQGKATFEFFVRNLPKSRNFLIAAGLEQFLEFVGEIKFSQPDLEWLAKRGFGAKLLNFLSNFRFTGDVHAMPEGTIFFPDEPILRVTAPLPQAQLLETRAINLLHFQSVIASKAARMVLAAPGKQLVDFGLRRRMDPRPDYWRPGPATPSDLPALRQYWPASALAFRSMAPWLIRLSKLTMMS